MINLVIAVAKCDKVTIGELTVSASDNLDYVCNMKNAPDQYPAMGEVMAVLKAQYASWGDMEYSYIVRCI